MTNTSKKQLKLSSLIVGLSIFLNSCAFHDGTMSGNAALSNANFRQVGAIEASNKCVYVFGLGGNAKAAQITALKQQLQKQFPLRNGLAWANVSLEMKTGFYVLFSARKATLAADIIDFWPDTNTTYSAYNGYYLNDSSYIYVPQQLKMETRNTDLLFDILKILSATKDRNTISKLTLSEVYELTKNTEVAFNYRKKLYKGIVLNTETSNTELKYVTVAFLYNNDKVKKANIHTRDLYKIVK